MRRPRRRRTGPLVALAATAVLAVSACGDDDAPLFPESDAAGTTAAAPATTAAGASTATGAASTAAAAGAAPAPAGSPDAGAIITTVSSSLGTIVADRDGRTLYVFDNDEGRSGSTCVDQCATNWPPVKASGAPIGAGSVDGSLLGTTPRSDGTLQVTYGGRPLYYFKGDQKAGDTLGQNVGGLWHAVDAKGQKVTGGSTAAATTAAAAAPSPAPAAATTAAPTTAAPTTAAGPATVVPADTALGKVLTDADGLTLYALESEKPQLPTPSCYSSCAETWPPLVITGAPVAGGGLDPALLGVVPRDGGATQVTYNKWPLYRFAGDRKPGDTNGQGVGGVWFVLGADGKLVKS
jgi:predicted lipoprotein with Yx(FWY)xxD motif